MKWRLPWRETGRIGPQVSELMYSPTAYWWVLSWCGRGRCFPIRHDKQVIFGSGVARRGGIFGRSLAFAIFRMVSRSAWFILRCHS